MVHRASLPCAGQTLYCRLPNGGPNDALEPPAPVRSASRNQRGNAKAPWPARRPCAMARTHDASQKGRADRIQTFRVPHRMAVVSREIATAILELRSASLTLIAVVLKTTDLDALATDLERRASAMPGLFEDEPVAVDLSCVRDEEKPVEVHRTHRAAAPPSHGAGGGSRRQRRADGCRIRCRSGRSPRKCPACARATAGNAGGADRAHRRGATARRGRR